MGPFKNFASQLTRPLWATVILPAVNRTQLNGPIRTSGHIPLKLQNSLLGPCENTAIQLTYSLWATAILPAVNRTQLNGPMRNSGQHYILGPCGHILQKLQNGLLGPCKNLTIQLTYTTLGHRDFAGGESH
jgi:type III secretory pathway component EscT